MVVKSSVSQNANDKMYNQQFENNKINNMYFLGDSLIDNGGFIKVIHSASEELKKDIFINTLLKNKLEQLSILKLPSFYYYNSFSNGLVISENLANKLNISIKSGWNLHLNVLDLIDIKTLSIGNNYAFAGSSAYYSEQADQDLKNQFADLIRNPGIKIDELIKVLFKLMLNQFALVKQADALIKHHDGNIKENDVFLIQIGGNDIRNLAMEIKTLKATNCDQKTINLYINQYLNNSITNIETTITNLINNKVKKIVVTNCVDVSKAPECLKFSEQENKLVLKLVKLYNELWSKKINDLSFKYSKIIKQYDIFKYCNQLIKQMRKNGMNVELSASGFDFETIFEKMFTGNKNLKFRDYSDEKINNYFFIDDSHPTKKIHQLVAEEIFELIRKWG